MRLDQKANQWQLRWYRHMLKRNEQKLANKVLISKVVGNRGGTNQNGGG